jgi:ubiquinone/menaquinone biosynthesis C-methylase UbiE
VDEDGGPDKLSACKGCGSDLVKQFFSFGRLPMGNAFLRKDQMEAEPTFGLDLGFCEGCKLVQQINPAPREVIESVYKNYAYVPFGNTLEAHYGGLGRTIANELKLTKDSFALDIGSNDGILLRSIKLSGGCRILGVEPAVRISETARKSGVPTVTAFFAPEVASTIAKEHGLADVVTITQVLQHVTDLVQFLRDAIRLVKPTGCLVIEGRYFGETIKKVSFDTVYHEMLYFFTLESLENLLGRMGMEVFKAEQIDIYGGSLRIYSRRVSESKKGEVDTSRNQLLDLERNTMHLNRFSTYADFAKKVYLLRDELHDLLVGIKKSGKAIAGYGAPSTGTTLLSFCGLGKDVIDYVVDDSPLKQGLLTPGTHIPIVPSSQLTNHPPDYLLVIAWRLADDIVAKVKPLLPNVDLIIPLPSPKIVRAFSGRQA